MSSTQEEMMSQSEYDIEQLISAKSIAARIEELALEIQKQFANTEKLIVVGLLRGSFVFIADFSLSFLEDLENSVSLLDFSSKKI